MTPGPRDRIPFSPVIPLSDGTPEVSKDRARYAFKRALEELKEARGSATQLISLYIPPDTQIHDVVAQLRNEYGQAQNIKSKGTMKNVTSALESAIQALKNFKNPGPHGVVVFVGAKSIGSNQTRMVKHVIEPPLPLTLRKYHCDSSFFLEPLESMLKEHNNYGLIVLDRQEATLGFLRGQAVQVTTNMQSMVPNKHAKGGQSARRFERITEEIADKWFQKIGETANEIFMPEYERGELKGIIVGGPGPTKEYWADEGYLHHELQKRVVGAPIDTGYTDEYGLRDLVANAHNLLKDLGLTEEKDLLQRFMRELAKPDGGLAAYGEDEVRRMIELGAVETLVLSEKLRKYRVTLACENGDFEKSATVPIPDHFLATTGNCPTCNSQLTITAEDDVVSELSEVAESMGSKVTIVSAGSDEGELLFKAFGGIAAILRYRP